MPVSFYAHPSSLPDINECEVRNGECEHGCVNKVGSHECICNDGYALTDDERTCNGKSDGKLVLQKKLPCMEDAPNTFITQGILRIYEYKTAP